MNRRDSTWMQILIPSFLVMSWMTLVIPLPFEARINQVNYNYIRRHIQMCILI
ncbi:MAG: hypothetical protein KDD45_07410 [Bdellovibrionales bacterium]|nr:hypothetical protein [Bdellovibrionales bacterium]